LSSVVAAPKTVLVRAVGARLAGFGLAGALADPKLEVYRGALKVADNDDWAQAVTAADFTAAGAFALDADAKSAAVKLTLTAGAGYTVHVTGTGGVSGDVLLEVYEPALSAPSWSSRLMRAVSYGRRLFCA